MQPRSQGSLLPALRVGRVGKTLGTSLRTMVSLANFHKRHEVLARNYVTSHSSDESVTGKHMKTIEMAPPSWVDLSRGRGLLQALNNWRHAQIAATLPRIGEPISN